MRSTQAEKFEKLCNQCGRRPTSSTYRELCSDCGFIKAGKAFSAQPVLPKPYFLTDANVGYTPHEND